MSKLKFWFILSGLTVLSATNVLSQKVIFCNCDSFDIIKKSNTISYKPRPCASPEISPEFPGGSKKLKEYIQLNSSLKILYNDKSSNQDSIEKVFVCIEPNNTGEIIVKKVRTHNEKYRTDASKIIDSMPKWIPAKQNGIPVKGYTLIMIPYKKC